MTPIGSWALDAEQADRVWERLDLDSCPYPLEIHRFGSTEEQRRARAVQVDERLREDGVLSGERLDGELANALRLLVTAPAWIDSVWASTGDDPARFVVAGDQHATVLVIQGPDHELSIWSMTTADLAELAIAELPHTARGQGRGGVLPVRDLTGDPRRDAQDGFLRTVTTSTGTVSRTKARVSAVLLVQHDRGGQLTVNTRDRMGRRTRATPLGWFDNAEDGRYLLATEDGQDRQRWVSVLPAEPGDLANRLRSALNSTPA